MDDIKQPVSPTRFAGSCGRYQASDHVTMSVEVDHIVNDILCTSVLVDESTLTAAGPLAAAQRRTALERRLAACSGCLEALLT